MSAPMLIGIAHVPIFHRLPAPWRIALGLWCWVLLETCGVSPIGRSAAPPSPSKVARVGAIAPPPTAADSCPIASPHVYRTASGLLEDVECEGHRAEGGGGAAGHTHRHDSAQRLADGNERPRSRDTGADGVARMKEGARGGARE